jgi:hypothetical protein
MSEPKNEESDLATRPEEFDLHQLRFGKQLRSAVDFFIKNPSSYNEAQVKGSLTEYRNAFCIGRGTGLRVK